MTNEKQARSFKILVVDDSNLARKIIRQELETDGYEVLEAINGIDALIKATTGRPPDLITLDVEMPRLNGFETCKKLRDRHYSRFFSANENEQIPIIFVTSLDTLAVRQEGFKVGATDFLTKPFERGEILAAVNRILRPEHRLQGMTVLVVDDSRLARQIVAGTLRQKGVTVLEAEDGQAAFDIICKQMNDIDLLLTDLIMPVMKGDELCMKTRHELGLKDLPIVFLTASEDQNEILNLFKAGANDYLIKPFVREELLARLEVHLDRAQLNKRLRESISELQSLNRMKDDLLAVCSHDLRSPLTGILGFTGLLLEKDYLEKDDRENLTQVVNSGEFLLSLINDILDLSKSQAETAELETEPLSMPDVARTSLKALEHMANAKKQRLEFIDHSSQHIVAGNRSGLIRVFNNLLSNAIKFTPEGKEIQMVMENSPAERLVITITDQGIGIAPDKLPFLFDKFSKASRSGTSGEKGTGLGMSIIKEMVEKHGGEIQVDSVEGRGSSFRISLPLAAEAKAQEPEAVAAVEDLEASEKRSCTILVAEDNPVNSRLAVKFLEKAGHQVTVAANGKEALERLESTQFDLIFMDMHMPEMDGLEAAKALRARKIETPVIALTGSTSENDVNACTRAGMNDFLTKPFKAVDLTSKISQWVKP